MFNDCFNLNFVMVLQKKYYKSFKNWNSNVLVLPPIFKRLGLNVFLYFPVAKRLKNNSISRPIGIIRIAKNNGETLYNLDKYEYCHNFQDFDKAYCYKIENQENIKYCLNTLSTIFTTKGLKKKKLIYEQYLDKIKNLFEQSYWIFYKDLITNQILPVSDYLLKMRKRPNNIDIKQDYQEILKKEISKFVKKEILSSIQTYPSIAKVQFFDKLGKHIRSIELTYDKDKEIESNKFEITKIYAKILSKNTKSELQVDFISKVILMILNALLLEQKKKTKTAKLEEDLQNYFEIFEEEISAVENIEQKEYLKQIKNYLVNDHSLQKNQKFSDIFFAYLYIFL